MVGTRKANGAWSAVIAVPARRTVVWAALGATGAVAASVVTAATPLLQQNVFLLFMFVILGSALGGGTLPGLVASLASLLGGCFFLLPPIGALTVAAGPDQLRAIFLATASLLITALSQVLRHARRRVAERERALRESDSSYRALFNNSADALLILDRDGRIVEANREAGRLCGLPPEAMVGRTPRHLSDLDRVDVEAQRDRIQAVFNGQSARFEWWGRHQDGTTFPLEVALSRTTYFGRTAALAVARDLTARRQLEDQLRQSQKMEAVGRLAGGVSHDFNNLLTTIRGHTSLLADALDVADPLQTGVGEIERAADLATHVTRQLLAFSRSADTGRPEVIPLDPVVEGMEKMLRRVIGAGVAIDLELAAGDAAVRMDPGHLEQVLLNLVVNARDAMPDGGTITLRTSATGRPGEPAARARLTVEDTGTGMRPETVDRIFDPFFTTKPRGEGTGLGLSTVYGIVQQHGGSIRVESEPGRGARFHVEVPSILRASGPASAEGPRATRREARPPLGTAERILLVEDEEPVRALMTRILERAGYRVTAAGCAAEAWDRFADDPAAPELVVTDVSLPGESGPRLAARLRERAPGIPVLFASGSDGLGPDASDVAEPRWFLAKPFTPAELTTAVRRALDVSPASAPRVSAA